MWLAMEPVREIPWSVVAEMSEERHDCKFGCWEWSRREEQKCKLFTVKYHEVGKESLAPSVVGWSGRYFLPLYQPEHGAVEGNVTPETQNDSWQGNFSTEDSPRR